MSEHVCTHCSFQSYASHPAPIWAGHADQLDEADGGLASGNNSGTFLSARQGELAEAWI